MATPIHAVQSDFIAVELLQVGVAQSLMRDYPTLAKEMQVSVEKRFIEGVVYYFHSFIANIKKQDFSTYETVQYPASAWEHIKQDYAPKWFLQHYPVKYETKTIEKAVTKHFICPHLDVPHEKDRCVFWLWNASNDKASYLA